MMGPKKMFCFVEFSLSLSLCLSCVEISGVSKFQKKVFQMGVPGQSRLFLHGFPNSRKRELKECDLKFGNILNF